MLSPRSRGKGSRRCPGRDGGLGKRRPTVWRKQVVHAVEEFPKGSGELTDLTYSCPFGHSAAEGIYLFDQLIAGTGILYQAELRRGELGRVFTIRVPTSFAVRVSAIIAQIEKR